MSDARTGGAQDVWFRTERCRRDNTRCRVTINGRFFGYGRCRYDATPCGLDAGSHPRRLICDRSDLFYSHDEVGDILRREAQEADARAQREDANLDVSRIDAPIANDAPHRNVARPVARKTSSYSVQRVGPPNATWPRAYLAVVLCACVAVAIGQRLRSSRR